MQVEKRNFDYDKQKPPHLNLDEGVSRSGLSDET